MRCSLSLLAVRVRFGLHLSEFVAQLIDGRSEHDNFRTRGGKIAIGCGDFFVGFASQLAQRLLKVFDVGLQTSSATVYLLLGRTDFQSWALAGDNDAANSAPATR